MGSVHLDRGRDRHGAGQAAEVTGEERDRLYAAQVRVSPTFGEYEQKTAGIRTIPVIRLTPTR